MATIISHAISAVAIGSAFSPRLLPRWVWVTGAVCAMIPDLDLIGFGFEVGYEDFWGHRGFTHSFCFAGIMAIFLTWTLLYHREHKNIIACYLFLAFASHGVLDAFTNGGLGVAFFSPIDNTRYFFPYSPLKFRRLVSIFLVIVANRCCFRKQFGFGCHRLLPSLDLPFFTLNKIR